MNPAIAINTNPKATRESASVRNPATSARPTDSFPVGYHDLHPDISINFQLNRFYGWVGDDSMLTEMREAAAGLAGVQDYSAFTKKFIELGDKALARHEELKGAYYLRLAEFFLHTKDPRKLPTRQRAIAHAATKHDLVAKQRPPGWMPPNMFQFPKALTAAEVMEA